MSYTLITLIIGLLMTSPINKVDRPEHPPIAGRYIGTSSFVPEDPADQPYADTIDIWFVFEDSAYYYGEGDTLPGPDDGGDGGGPYVATDSTITLNGAYPKILKPVIVLRGLFEYEIHGDTLVMSQSSVKGSGSGHLLRLERQ